MSKKVALVTGAGRGIGRKIAEILADNDFNIVVDDVWEESDIKETIDAIKSKNADVLYIKADISKDFERQRIIKEIKDKFNRLDLLVNNAGVAPKVRADILEAGEESFDRLIRINLKGPYFLTQLVANWMIEQKKNNDSISPKIINVSSISAYTSSPGRGEYCISKAAVSMMTKLYADRLSEYNINVYEIRPGIIMTDMTSVVKDKYDKLIAEGLTPIKRWGYPEDIGKAAAALASGSFDFSTGEVINVDGGFHLRRL